MLLILFWFRSVSVIHLMSSWILFLNEKAKVLNCSQWLLHGNYCTVIGINIKGIYSGQQIFNYCFITAVPKPDLRNTKEQMNSVHYIYIYIYIYIYSAHISSVRSSYICLKRELTFTANKLFTNYDFNIKTFMFIIMFI